MTLLGVFKGKLESIVEKLGIGASTSDRIAFKPQLCQFRTFLVKWLRIHEHDFHIYKITSLFEDHYHCWSKTKLKHGRRDENSELNPASLQPGMRTEKSGALKGSSLKGVSLNSFGMLISIIQKSPCQCLIGESNNTM